MALRDQQRRDLVSFGEGLEDLFAGEPSYAGSAAARNVAEVLSILANANTAGKWSKG